MAPPGSARRYHTAFPREADFPGRRRARRAAWRRRQHAQGWLSGAAGARQDRPDALRLPAGDELPDGGVP